MNVGWSGDARLVEELLELGVLVLGSGVGVGDSWVLLGEFGEAVEELCLSLRLTERISLGGLPVRRSYGCSLFFRGGPTEERSADCGGLRLKKTLLPKLRLDLGQAVPGSLGDGHGWRLGRR